MALGPGIVVAVACVASLAGELLRAAGATKKNMHIELHQNLVSFPEETRIARDTPGMAHWLDGMKLLLS